MQTPDSTPQPNPEIPQPVLPSPNLNAANSGVPPLPEPFGSVRHCPKCNAILQDKVVFCPQCGERLDGKPLSFSQWAMVGCLGLGAFVVGGLGSCIVAFQTGLTESYVVGIIVLGGLIFAGFSVALLVRTMRRR